MKYALGINPHHPFDPRFATPEFIRSYAETAEASGFDAVFFSEHPMPGDNWLATGGFDALDPYVALAFAAASTRSLRILTYLAVLPYRNPFITAKTVATLDRLSGGRLVLGIGGGYLEPEFEAVGVDFGRRNDLYDEYLHACRLAWSGQSVDLEASTFRATGNTALPTPLQDPVPLLIGGNAEISLRRASTSAQGWCPQLNPRRLGKRRRSPHLETLEDLAQYLGRLRGMLAEAGRSDEPFDVLWFNLDNVFGSETFDMDAYFDEEERQEQLGVTWNGVNCPTTSPAAALEWISAFGERLIAPRRARAHV